MEIKKILIANRGEIALRVMQTCRQMGIQTVSLYTESERDYPHALLADQSFCLGDGPLSETYLHQERMIAIAKESGADAIHPGYGLLSEKASFAQAIEGEGLIFIGPTPGAMALMGDKINSKEAVANMNVPVLPSYHHQGKTTLRPPLRPRREAWGTLSSSRPVRGAVARGCAW